MRNLHRACENERDYLHEWVKIKDNLIKCLERDDLSELQKATVKSIIRVCEIRINQASQPGFTWAPIMRDE